MLLFEKFQHFLKAVEAIGSREVTIIVFGIDTALMCWGIASPKLSSIQRDPGVIDLYGPDAPAFCISKLLTAHLPHPGIELEFVASLWVATILARRADRPKLAPKLHIISKLGFEIQRDHNSLLGFVVQSIMIVIFAFVV